MNVTTPTIPEMQTDIIRRVLELDSERLSKVHTLITMLENEADDTAIEGFRFSDKPKSQKQIIAELDAIVEDVKKGNFVTFDELIEKTDKKIANYECCLV